ncbi:MAG: hypothetical protein K2L25_02825 [Alphaproteobacteria bacterium]|nr:hypothetical protein [Alphaproteobacteria bacterium]
MRNTIFLTAATILLAGCNSIHVSPGTMTPAETVYADRGGYTMRRSIKIELERRGYNVVVGKAISNRDWSDGGSDLEIETSRVPNQARYYIKVKERDEKFRPIWCVFNGIWWWNFNVSIADQSTGKELMTWRGRGCADSSMRLLRRTLDKMERQNEQQ